MEQVIRAKILALLDQHRNMTLATSEPAEGAPPDQPTNAGRIAGQPRPHR
jgi:hypothetical protein